MKTFRKNGMVGYLGITQIEGAGYRWKSALALTDQDGRWLLSTHWRSNAHKKAERKITALGWIYDGEK